MLSYEEIKKLKLHDPFITGNNQSYLAVGYFPSKELKTILPTGMSLPSDEVMDREYPTVRKISGAHPFLLMFSRCFNVHDVITQIELRPYLELLFFFPMIYRHKNEERLCSYLPVLYLDFLLGTMGGLFLALRKEFHPKLKYVETEEKNSFLINNTLRASFSSPKKESPEGFDPFFAQIFNKPTMTLSYFNQIKFYTTSVYPKKVFNTSADYEWKHKGSLIKNDKISLSSYCEYNFTTSWAMRYDKYFYPDYALE